MHLVSAYPSDIAVARAMRGQRGVISVVDLAALKALKSRPEVVIVETGQAKGVWQWALGDSTTADDGTVVEPTSGTAGRYFRIYNGAKDVTWFGALGDDSTDNSTAITAALSAASGEALYFPAGDYRTSGTHTASFVNIIGDGASVTSIKSTSGTAIPLTMSTSATVRGIKFLASVTRTAGPYIDVTGDDVVVEDCEFEGAFKAVRVGTTAGSIITNAQILRNAIRTPAVTSGAGAIELNYFSNAQVIGNVVTGPALPDTQPDFGLRIRRGDTAFVIGNNITRHGKALLVDTPAAVSAVSVKLIGNCFDESGTVTGATTVSSAEIIPSGEVKSWVSVGNWYGGSQSKSGLFMEPPSGGLINGWTSSSDLFMNNGDCGLLISTNRNSKVSITSPQAGGNASAGVRAANAPTGWTILGGVLGPCGDGGANDWGFLIDNATAADNFAIIGVDCRGNTSGGGFDGSSGTDKTIFGTLGFSTWSLTPTAVLAELTASGKIVSTSATAGVGYATGAGGTVTQGSGSGKATGVTLSKVTGLITMDAAALAADTTVSFTLTNTAIAATDTLILNHASGGTAGSYLLNAQAAAGSASISVRNITGGSLSEAIVIRFTVIKSVSA